jgi:hypothetical protein
VICETTDFMFPMLADVYYPIVEQTALGSVKKQWVLDRSIACSFSSSSGGSSSKEEIVPNIDITQTTLLAGRVKTDIRISSRDNSSAITNVIITNIRSSNGESIYMETSGVRKGQPTIFEIASQRPFSGPFGSVEYYTLLLRRSENQAADV